MAPYAPSTSLISPGRIGQAAWNAALVKQGASDRTRIVDLYHAYAPTLGLNPDLALAQAVVETGWFSSALWLQRFNPCGLGITGPGVPGKDYGTAQNGIKAHLHHLCCYAYTLATCPVQHADSPDPRHDFHDGNPRLSHLQEPPPGRQWATGPAYVAKILAVANALLLTQETAMTVQKPPMVSTPSPNKGGYNSPHESRCIFWHISQGTNSLGWLQNPASNASSNYLIARNGTINELVKPDESAWANGQTCNPDKTNAVIAQALAEGRNLNTVSISIEHEGFSSNNQGGSLTPQQIAATVQLTAWLCATFGIAPDQDHILGHYQADDCTRHYCPGFSATEWTTWVNAVAALVNGGAPAPAMQSPIVTPAHTWGGKGRVISLTLVARNDDEGQNYSAVLADGVQAPWVKV